MTNISCSRTFLCRSYSCHLILCQTVFLSRKIDFLVRRISQAGVLLFLSRYFLCNSCNLPRSIRFQIILKYFCWHNFFISADKISMFPFLDINISFSSWYFLCNSCNLPRSIQFQIILKYFCRQNIYFPWKKHIFIFRY